MKLQYIWLAVVVVSKDAVTLAQTPSSLPTAPPLATPSTGPTDICPAACSTRPPVVAPNSAPSTVPTAGPSSATVTTPSAGPTGGNATTPSAPPSSSGNSTTPSAPPSSSGNSTTPSAPPSSTGNSTTPSAPPSSTNSTSATPTAGPSSATVTTPSAGPTGGNATTPSAPPSSSGNSTTPSAPPSSSGNSTTPSAPPSSTGNSTTPSAPPSSTGNSTTPSAPPSSTNSTSATPTTGPSSATVTTPSGSPALTPSTVPISLSPATPSAPITPSLRPVAPVAPVAKPPTIPLPPSITGIFGGVCFSGVNKVEVEATGLVPMSDLRIGDKVKDATGSMVTVYGFGHYAPNAKAAYLQIFADGLEKPLEISKDHLLFVNGTAVPASTVSVGDEVNVLQGKQSGVAKVKKIRPVFRNGAYAPFTTSGSIVVSDIVSSSYVTHQADSPVVVLGKTPTPISMHWLSHVFLSPHRVMCYTMGTSYCIKHASFNRDGLSEWLETSYALANWVFRQNGVVLGLVIVPAAILGGMVYAVEIGWLYLLLALGASYVVLRKHAIKKSV